jgi:hypothetical protein
MQPTPLAPILATAAIVAATWAGPVASQAAFASSPRALPVEPFPASCRGLPATAAGTSTGCVWEMVQQQERSLRPLLGSERKLRQWRTVRNDSCRRAHPGGSGQRESLLPRLRCEVAMNESLLRKLRARAGR